VEPLRAAIARFCSQCGGPLAEHSAFEEGSPRLRKRCPQGHTHYGNPVPVVAALVEQEGHVWLVQNKGWPAGMFGLVTGYLEAGESPEAGALRELREELSLTGVVESLIGVYPFELKNELIIAYHVRAEGTVAMSDELAACKRVPVEKLRPWPVATGFAVADWLARRGGGT
jgi:NAD+ diphosphatase